MCKQGSSARLAKKMRALMAALPGDESSAEGGSGLGLRELLAVCCHKVLVIRVLGCYCHTHILFLSLTNR